jgi:hypothetical protein
MKKLIVISVAVALLLLASRFTPALAQAPASNDKPTFYRLVLGTYVNGCPRFTFHYPKDGVQLRHRPENDFVAGAPGPTTCLLQLDRDDRPDKPAQLRDGTLAREIEFTFTADGEPLHRSVFSKIVELAFLFIEDMRHE